MPAEFPPSAPWSMLGHLVSVHALVGLDERTLLIRDQDAAAYRLPGSLVHTGESVEDALRRSVLQQLGADIDHLNFYAAVELRDQSAVGEHAAFELALVFDVTPIAAIEDHQVGHELCWFHASDMHGIELRPAALGDLLRNEQLGADRPWWPADA